MTYTPTMKLDALKTKIKEIFERTYQYLFKDTLVKDVVTQEYSTKFFLGQVTIPYENSGPVEATVDLHLKANKLLEHYNLVSVSDQSKIRLVSGFAVEHKDFVTMREIETYKGETNEEMYSKAGHTIKLPITPIPQNKEGRLIHITQLAIHYDENRKNETKVPHYYFLEMMAPTKQAVCIFIIPIGNHSYTENIQVKIKDGEHHTMSISKGLRERVVHNQFFELTNGFGNGWVEYREEIKQIITTVVITNELERGSACKFEWDTIPK